MQNAKGEEKQAVSYHALTFGNVTSLILKVQTHAHENNFPSFLDRKIFGAPMSPSAPEHP